ncbi:type I secretion system permease/ATPase [Pseudomonas sp. OV226]|uniref:type I secretion system permease/ATPase n=1 Tax=Pseudomonas sp. OV226 TaxID=2135588 RepID=UPI00130493AE|nr:type I secretion system permease/ATPase [Pseudomonas sp. OV226]
MDLGNSSMLRCLRAALRQAGHSLSLHDLGDNQPSAPSIQDLHGANASVSRQWSVDALRRHGLYAGWHEVDFEALKPSNLPAILLLEERLVVLYRLGETHCRVVDPSLGDEPVAVETAALRMSYSGNALLFKAETRVDNRSDELVRVQEKHWFWGTVWRFKRFIAEAVALSVVINVLALAMSIFTMSVYNRVLPNQAYVTLWTMAIGVSLALLFEFGARVGRAWVLDRAGKKIDLILGAKIFRHVLATRLESRAQSSGAFANVVQSFETVRDMVTSATLTAVADLPFALLFLLVIYLVAGPLVWVVVGTMLAVVALALLIQIPLKRDSQNSMKVASNRHGLVVESLDNLETIKALRAESWIASRHDAASVQLAQLSMQTRFLSSWATTLLQSFQQFSTVALLLWGAYLVGDGTISMGGIIATMTLSARAIAPIGVLAAMAVRLQQARTSLASLEQVMAKPKDRSPKQVYVQLPAEGPEVFRCHDLSFRYKKELPPVADGLELSVRPGERIAILGKMGSGKSTLLRLLAGLYQPTGGRIVINGVDSRQVDPGELRSHVALVSQEPRLMYGTLRDNLLMAAPHASDEQMLHVASLTGVSDIVARHPMGFGMPVGERGDTLSGGQKQAIALARALLARPSVLLLDEPTSGMDMGSERTLMSALGPAMEGRTVIIVTHKPALLQFVERIVVMDDGVKVADGPKEQILQALNSGKIPSGSELRSAAKTWQPTATFAH